MELEELMERLEIDDPSDFEYFETFAELVESDEDIPEETLYELFAQVEAATVGEVIESYFDELMENMPDDYEEMFLLMENIKRSLCGLLLNREDENALNYFAEELRRFRQWYNRESEVLCTRREDRQEQLLPLRDALVLARMERLGEDEYDYSFDGCMEYEIEEFILNIAMNAMEEEDDEEDEE